MSVARSAGQGVVPEDQAPALRARLNRLSDRSDAAHAEAAIEQARRALQRADDATDQGAKARALETARAAMVLGERRLHLREVRAELIATQRRLTGIRERAASQRRVLEALMKERASLARAGEQP